MSPCVLITCDFLQLVGYSACRTGPLARKPQSPWARLNTDTSTSPVSSMVGQSGPLYQPVGRTVDGQWLLSVSGRYANKIKDIGHHALPTSLGHRPQHPRGWTCSLCIFWHQTHQILCTSCIKLFMVSQQLLVCISEIRSYHI